MVQPLVIRSGQGDYRVDFLERLDVVAGELRAIPRALLLADRNVVRLYRESLAPLFDHLPLLPLDASEEVKSFSGVAKAATWLQECNATKQHVLVAVGGGIIQDIAAFTAHIYYRGIPWIYVPTTLLSMCDSCIGAKCGINLNAFKNQLGFFHAPSRVFICTAFVDTLTDQDVASGYGEILKLMFTESRAHLERLEQAVAVSGLRNPELPQLIYESLLVKKRIIEEDEYEKDLRRILNYGHTFGHALEAITNHEVPHGLAVAWGMDLANFISLRHGWLSELDFQMMQQFIHKYLAFRRARGIQASALIQGARRDKKVADGQINLILAERPGSLKIVKTSFDAQLETQVSEYIARHQRFDDR